MFEGLRSWAKGLENKFPLGTNVQSPDSREKTEAVRIGLKEQLEAWKSTDFPDPNDHKILDYCQDNGLNSKYVEDTIVLMGRRPEEFGPLLDWLKNPRTLGSTERVN